MYATGWLCWLIGLLPDSVFIFLYLVWVPRKLSRITQASFPSGCLMDSVNKRYQLNNQFSSVTQSCPTLWPHEPQHARPPCPSPTPGVYSNSCPLSWWCHPHPTISSSVIPFTSHLQSFPASGSFQMSQFFTSGGQSIGVLASASVLPMNIQGWFPLWTGWISLLFKGP